MVGQIGPALIQIRMNLDLTQGEVAELTGYDQSTISKFELGKTEMNVPQLSKYISDLGGVVEVGYFFHLFNGKI